MFAMKNDSKAKQMPKYKGSGKGATLASIPLAPSWLVYPLFIISFCVPNLVFSGRNWFDTLHIMKWFVTMVPIGVLALVAGVTLVRFGAKRTNFSFDPFSIGWFLLLLLISVQPFFIRLSSLSTYAKEWFYFACLFATYLLAYHLCKSGRLLRVLLWGANINAAINVLFAELLIRGMNKPFPFILDVPGNYIGNTAQQEMFGLWMAMAILNCLFLHLYYVSQAETGENTLRKPLVFSNLFLLAINAWGLWSSTTRGAILSLIVAFVILVVGLWRSGDRKSVKSSLKLFGVVIALLAVVLIVSSMIGTGRGNALVSKMWQMIQNPTSVGNRISIWKTSWEVFLKEPVTGVGLGQYKWHFLDGQRLLFQNHPELLNTAGYDWQFTYWAHSEYIQWLCETGIIGALILGVLGVWWLVAFIRKLAKGEPLPPEALWGCAMAFLLWFDALFSRPFHRIENSVWMSLAFALSNRAMLPQAVKWLKPDSDLVYRGFGVLLAGVALYGFIFLGGGMKGDQLMYRAIAYQSNVSVKTEQLGKAQKYLMSRDDAREQMAQLNINVGKLQNNPDSLAQGVRDLYAAFLRRPTSKLLFELLQYSKAMPEGNVLQRELVKYLKPDMYRAVPGPQSAPVSP